MKGRIDKSGFIYLPISYIALFSRQEDCLHEQGRRNTVLIIRKENQDIFRNEQIPYLGNKSQQDILHERDVRLFQYNRHNYKVLWTYNQYNVIHILSQS